jgi:hypothetical protein
MEIFGFKIERLDQVQDKTVKSFTQPEFDDGAVTVSSGGVYGHYLDLEGSVRNDVELINKYREMIMQPEVEVAVDDIINEVINPDEAGDTLKVSLDKVKLTNPMKEVIYQEFNKVIDLLEFREKSYEMFRKWYVDGRLYYHVVIDEKDPSLGIQELRYVDPRKIKKVVEFDEVVDPKTRATEKKIKNEYFVYSNEGFVGTSTFISAKPQNASTIKIAPGSVIYCDSGIMDRTNKMVLSHLHKAIKPVNQLRALEDAAVIYRLARAPERRIFYIDVGNLPKMKAEQYLRDMMQKHKNKLVYDASSGEIRDDRKFMTMLEDYWLPRREGGRGTEIGTLPGGTNLGQMEDILYFQKKLYRALNVPVSRMEAEVSYTLGRASEISRDEVKFNKFVKRLRVKFNEFLYSCLRTQLVLKGIMNSAEFDSIKKDVLIRYNENNFYTELKENEIFRERLITMREAEEFNGKYFSTDYIKKHILRQSDKDIARIQGQMVEEFKIQQALEAQMQPQQQPQQDEQQ